KELKDHQMREKESRRRQSESRLVIRNKYHSGHKKSDFTVDPARFILRSVSHWCGRKTTETRR
ncbi:ACT domain-containing protein ACR7, partial [Clarias magur]